MPADLPPPTAAADVARRGAEADRGGLGRRERDRIEGAAVRRFQPVVRITGYLLCVLAVLMLVPAVVDASYGNPDWRVFVLSAVFTGMTGLLLAVSAREEQQTQLKLREAFVLTTLLWFVTPAFGAIPFLGIGIDYRDGWFEAVSGLTTTGSTVLTGLDDLPPGILLWRALLQWIGGIGIIVMAMVILPFLKVGGMQLFRTESSDRSEKIVPRAFDLAIWISSVYFALTLVCALAYAAGGMTPFDAILHAMTTLSTGGYSSHDASFGHFDAAMPAITWAGSLFMLCGALPLVLFIRAVRGEAVSLFGDPQVRAFIGFLAVTCLLVAIWLTLTTGYPFEHALRQVTFNVISVVTTTGYAANDYTLWGPFAVGLFFILTFVGGCTGSTAGGIKIYRFIILSQVLRRQLRVLANPSLVEPMVYQHRRIPPDVPPSVLAFLTVYVMTIAVVTLVLTGMGLDFVTAMSSAATAISNVGPGLGPIVGPAGTFATLPDAAKVVLSFAMILGRLELFTVLVLLDPRFWRW